MVKKLVCQRLFRFIGQGPSSEEICTNPLPSAIFEPLGDMTHLPVSFF